jgi:hypothetical protein
MVRKTRYWISAVYSLWCSVGFVYLIGWVIYQVITGKQSRWMLFLAPIYGLLSWSFYRVFIALRKKIRESKAADAN